MTAKIQEALQSGFTSQQVIDFILKKFPKYEKKIKDAVKYGFNAEQILDFLSDGAVKKTKDQSRQIANTQSAEMNQRKTQKREDLNSNAFIVLSFRQR